MSSLSLERQPALSSETHGAGLTADVVVLSADVPLFDAIRASIDERSPVRRARSAEDAVDLLLAGRCGVLVMDMALVSNQPATLVEQIVAQFPDVVVVVAGRREDETLLAQLISEGLVYRFMHKPLTARRAGMFLNAAMRSHAERRGLRAAEQLLPLVSSLPSRIELRKWLFVAAGVAIFVTLLTLLPRGRGGHETPVPTVSPRARPPAPVSATRPPLADPVLSRARAALAAGRYEAPPGRNALDLYSAVLLARPGHPEARAGLERTVGQVVAIAEQARRAGQDAEARRLLERARAADPGNAAIGRLAALLKPGSESTPAASTVASSPEPALRPLPEPATVPAMPATTTAAPAVIAPSQALPAASSPLRAAAVIPDPLTPRVTNAEALHLAGARPAQRAHEPLVFGPPVSSGHPIAGYSGNASAGFHFVQPTPQERLVSFAMPPAAADELERVVAPDPVYPPDALINGIEGWVELAITVTETGTVRDVEVVNAQPRGVFEPAAVAAVGLWRFRPRLANGQPVAQRTVVTLRFNVER